MYGVDETRMWVRCTPKERAAWEKYAADSGRDVSKLARFLLNREVTRAANR